MADETVGKLPDLRLAPGEAILGKVDRVLTRHYGFTAAELDFIINYDIKYRIR